MTDPRPVPSAPSGGCLAAAAGTTALVLLSPFVFVIRWWRRWRRGGAVRWSIDVQPAAPGPEGARRRIDATLDLPEPVGREVHRRATAQVVRVADALRRPGDTYLAVYRLRSDPEPFLIPVGPQLQRLGERFLLTLSQGVLAARTVVWLALGSSTPPVEVVDPVTCDPEDPDELDRLLLLDAARWSMASSWARVGPSWILRAILVVPAPSAELVVPLLEELARREA